jgi:hypothetical protein
MERKSRQTILHTAKELGKRVIMPDIDLVRPARAFLASAMPDQCVTPENFSGGDMRLEDKKRMAENAMQAKATQIPLDGAPPACCVRCYHRWHANRTKSVAFRMADDPQIRTIGIDTFGQFIDDILFANYGRADHIRPLDRKQFNRELVDFLNQISNKNLVLTHHSAAVYKDEKKTDRTKPMSSWSKIEHYVTVVAEMTRDEKRVYTSSGAQTEIVWTLKIADCQANAGLIGMELLTNEAVTFGNLAYFVYPEAPEGFFE